MSSLSVNSDHSEKVETSGGGETVSSSSSSSTSRFAQFQSSFYRKTSFAPKIKRKKGDVKEDIEKPKVADKEASVTDSEKDIER